MTNNSDWLEEAREIVSSAFDNLDKAHLIEIGERMRIALGGVGAESFGLAKSIELFTSSWKRFSSLLQLQKRITKMVDKIAGELD